MSGLKKQTSSTDAQGTTKGVDTGAKKNAIGGKIPDVDELAKRFAALKR